MFGLPKQNLMATFKFLIETIDDTFGRTDQINDYFQLQMDLLEGGHYLAYYSLHSDEIETCIKTKKHFYNFIRSFKFLSAEEIIDSL